MIRFHPAFRPLLFTCLFVPASPAGAEEPFRFPAGKQGNTAELKTINELPVLVVAGTPEEIGAAVGKLAVKPAPKALEYPKDLLKLHSVDMFYFLLVKGGNGMFRNFPADYQTELEAMVKASGADRDRLVVGNTMFDLKKIVACSAVMVEAERSDTGGPLLGRNLDYPSLNYIHEYSFVTVYRPRGKHAFASIGFPGLVGCLSGMNDAGLSLAVLEVFDAKNDEPTFDAEGVPYALCYRKVLEECTTIAEAKKLLEGMKRTTTTNLALADKTGTAVFEVTPKRVVQRSADKGVCCCTNHFCDAALKPEKPLNVTRSFERFEMLEKVRASRDKVKPDDLLKQLHEANLGDETLQTMVFEPAALKLHLAIGKLPSSQGPLKTLELGPLFKVEAEKKGE